jgi:hypothetical protein
MWQEILFNALTTVCEPSLEIVLLRATAFPACRRLFFKERLLSL